MHSSHTALSLLVFHITIKTVCFQILDMLTYTHTTLIIICFSCSFLTSIFDEGIEILFAFSRIQLIDYLILYSRSAQTFAGFSYKNTTFLFTPSLFSSCFILFRVLYHVQLLNQNSWRYSYNFTFSVHKYLQH